MAVISFVAGLAGFCFWGIGALVAIVLGHIALSQLKKPENGEGGKGFAIAGLCLGYLQLVAGIALLAIIFIAGGTIVDETTNAACRVEYRTIKTAAEAAYASDEPAQSIQDLVNFGYLTGTDMLGTYSVNGREVTQLDCPAS